MKNSVKNARFVTIMFLFASSASVLGKKFNFKDKNESLQAIVSANTSVFSRDNFLVSWGTPGNKEHDEAINLWNDLLEGIEKYVDKNNFWKSQIQQIYINLDEEIELIPRVGRHKIIFGDVSDMDEKFKKLMIFYKKGLHYTGWNKYKTINLKFKNQIVCTKI